MYSDIEFDSLLRNLSGSPNSSAFWWRGEIYLRESAMHQPKRLLQDLVHELMHELDDKTMFVGRAYPYGGAQNIFLFEIRARIAVRLITGEFAEGSLQKSIVDVLNLYRSEYPHWTSIWAAIWKKYQKDIRPYLRNKK